MADRFERGSGDGIKGDQHLSCRFAHTFNTAAYHSYLYQVANVFLPVSVFSTFAMFIFRNAICQRDGKQPSYMRPY